MMNIKITFLLFLTTGILSCNTKVKKDTIKETLQEVAYKPIRDFKGLIQTFPLKQLPIIDSSNFDNVKEMNEFDIEEIALLHLNHIYPEIEKQASDFRIEPSYRLNFHDHFSSLIITTHKGDHELESILINYDEDERLIDFKVIAYDEIAEGWSRKFSLIKDHTITVVDEFYGDTKQSDTSKFHVNRNGEINQIKTKFSSKLRPDAKILLGRTYIDTIEFIRYNDDGDYFILIGEKKDTAVSVIYDWEVHQNNQYDFEKGDSVKIMWKMDSIYIAGDGETLDFSERAVDAKKIK